MRKTKNVSDDIKKASVEPGKMTDVTKPGETPADATSRPVIVKHRSIMNDPMVAPANPSQMEDSNAENVSSAETKSKDEPVSRKGSKVQPPVGSDANEEKTKPDESSKKEETNSETSLGTAAVDALANQAVKKKNDNKEDTAKLEQIKKHIEDKTYFAPIGQISKRRAKMHGAIFVVFLLALIGFYVAIDAGLLLKDVALPFDLIK